MKFNCFGYKEPLVLDGPSLWSLLCKVVILIQVMNSLGFWRVGRENLVELYYFFFFNFSCYLRQAHGAIGANQSLEMTWLVLHVVHVILTQPPVYTAKHLLSKEGGWWKRGLCLRLLTCSFRTPLSPRYVSVNYLLVSGKGILEVSMTW